MAEKYSVSLEKLAKELGLKTVYTPKDLSKIMITNNDINRPGLQLTGFYAYFNTEKIQICGNTEFAYLKGLEDDERKRVLDTLFSYIVPALIITQDHEPFPEMLDAAKLNSIPIFSTALDTSAVMAQTIAFLNLNLAQRITRHGVLIEIYG